jgi:Putative porin
MSYKKHVFFRPLAQLLARIHCIFSRANISACTDSVGARRLRRGRPDKVGPIGRIAPTRKCERCGLAFLMCMLLVVPMAAADPAPISENVTVNLINRLVERGVITKQDAAELLKQAEEDAATAKAQAAGQDADQQVAAAKEAAAIQIAAAEEAAAKKVAAAKEAAEIQIAAAKEVAAIQAAAKSQAAVAQATDTAQPSAGQTSAAAPAAASASALPAASAPAPAAEDDTVRVTYVPEIVKAQLRSEIKQEVLAQARQEHWAAPNTLPSWISRFTPFGDIRIRYEGDSYPTGNDNTGSFPNFNAINTGAPFDTSQNNNNFPPELNVDQDRTRFRLRARMGTAIDLGEGFTSGFRIATGENDSPVTENQSLGVANSAQGGDFSKYAIWLDRAFIKYEVGGLPDKDLAITIGRFDNPFFDPSTLVWADGIGFDGAAVQGKYPINEDITPFLTFGGFPVYNTDLNFASNQPAKFKSEDKWLYAAQAGADWKVTQDLNFKVGGAYYYFQNIEGKLSTPFTPLSSADAGNTDDSRPSFAQNGNTYMPLRDIVANSLNNFGTINQFQYFGLATPFHELAGTARLDYNHFEPFQVSLWGEYENNLAFKRKAIAADAVNNRGATTSLTATGPFVGGDTAWIVGLTVGKIVLQKRWDWNVGLNYRHVESDSVVDGFDDADFGGVATGTNLQGYTLNGALALASHVWLGVRWMSASQIAGPVLKTDVLQVDINSKF